MFKKRKITKLLTALTQIKDSPKLPEFRIEEINELIYQNEYGLAFEVLLESFVEYQCELTTREIEQIECLGEKNLLNKPVGKNIITKLSINESKFSRFLRIK